MHPMNRSMEKGNLGEALRKMKNYMRPRDLVATFVALVFGQAGAAFVFGVRKPVARRGMPVRVYGLRAPPLD